MASHYFDPAQLRTEVQSRGLELLGAFVPVAFANESAHREGIERAVRTAKLMAEAVLSFCCTVGSIPGVYGKIL